MATAGSDGFYLDASGVRHLIKSGDEIPAGWTIDASSPAGLPALGARVSGQRGGIASVADGGTITHGLGATPTKVSVTPTVAARFVSVTSRSATTITVALKDSAGAAVSVAENVSWIAGR